MHVTFVEVPPFTTHRDRCFGSDAGFRAFQQDLMAAPDRWPVIPGAGPLRKARWGDEAAGRGKRGGLRIIYMSIPEIRTILLIHVYPKSNRVDLAKDEISYLAAISRLVREELIDSHRGEGK